MRAYAAYMDAPYVTPTRCREKEPLLGQTSRSILSIHRTSPVYTQKHDIRRPHSFRPSPAHYSWATHLENSSGSKVQSFTPPYPPPPSSSSRTSLALRESLLCFARPSIPPLSHGNRGNQSNRLSRPSLALRASPEPVRRLLDAVAIARNLPVITRGSSPHTVTAYPLSFARTRIDPRGDGFLDRLEQSGSDFIGCVTR
jgi:hypothetical protein